MLHDSLGSLRIFTDAFSHTVSQGLSQQAGNVYLYDFASAFLVAI